MMNLVELRMAVRTLPFLESQVDTRRQVLEIRGRPAPRLLVWHPELIEWIFRSDAELRHPGGRSLTPLFGERSLLWAEGPRHSAYRQVLGPQLRGRRLAERRGVVAGTVHSAIDALVPGSEVELLAWTRTIALRVIAGILFGRYDDALLDEVTAWSDRAFGARYRALAHRYLRGHLPRPGAELDRRLVRTARAHPQLRPPTLAALMLAGDGPLGEIDDAELRDAVVSLLFAGHETTASAAAWTLYWIDRNDSIRHDVLAELDATSSDGSDPTQVPLLQAVILETLRLTPSATLAGHRRLTEAGGPAGLELAAGTTLTPTIYLAHRNPDVFPQPNRFNPDRFLGARPTAQHYFPFGGGTRYCLGSQLAQLELRMITATLLRRRTWRCVNPRAGTAQLRGHVLAPWPSLRMRVLSCRD